MKYAGLIFQLLFSTFFGAFILMKAWQWHFPETWNIPTPDYLGFVGLGIFASVLKFKVTREDYERYLQNKDKETDLEWGFFGYRMLGFGMAFFFAWVLNLIL
jgi:hypothetical protein